MVKNIKYRTQQQLSYQDTDDNYNALLHYSGIWNTTDAYTVNELVDHEGAAWVCVQDNVNIEPGHEIGFAHWRPLIYPGSGAVTSSTPQVIGTLGATYVPIAFDTESFAGTGISFNFPGNNFVIDYAGIWNESVNLFFEHDSSNQGRTTFIRLWNATAGTEEGRVPIGIGRNVTDSNVTFSLPHRVSLIESTQQMRWEIGGLDTLNNVVISTFVYGALQHSI